MVFDEFLAKSQHDVYGSVYLREEGRACSRSASGRTIIDGLSASRRCIEMIGAKSVQYAEKKGAIP